MQVGPNVSTGNGLDFLAGRLSYVFNLAGPCLATHTACSSSLVATHLAAQGLREGDCTAAVPSGVFMILLAGTMAGISQLQVCCSVQGACSAMCAYQPRSLGAKGAVNSCHASAGCPLHISACPPVDKSDLGVMLLTLSLTACGKQAFSPVGRCKTFDAGADGYGRGEGCAALVLRPEGSVQPGGSSGPPLALLRGSLVNQDGPSSSLTAPNGPSQTALIASTIQAAGLHLHGHLKAVQQFGCCTSGLLVSTTTWAGRLHGGLCCCWCTADTACITIHLMLFCAGLEPGELGFVAVHGTGTPLGDPIEMGALGAALPAPSSNAARGVTIASVKSCYGHTEGCAGLTGAMLAMQALRHQVCLVICSVSWQLQLPVDRDAAAVCTHRRCSCLTQRQLFAQRQRTHLAWPGRVVLPYTLHSHLPAAVQETSPILHLRNMNPYVASALGDWRSKLGLAPAVPLSRAPRSSAGSLITSAGRPPLMGCTILPAYPKVHRALGGSCHIFACQRKPCAQVSRCMQLTPMRVSPGLPSAAGVSAQAGCCTGTSSFGMSGVNAHAIFGSADGQQTPAPAAAGPLIRLRHWPNPPLRHLLGAACSMRKAITFGVSLLAPQLAFLPDHKVPLSVSILGLAGDHAARECSPPALLCGTQLGLRCVVCMRRTPA